MTCAVNIRRARAEDAPQMVGLWNDVIDHSSAIFHSTRRRVDEVKNWIEERGDGFLVAHQGDELLAFATYFPFRAGNGYDYTVEYTVITAPNVRQKGAGRLVAEALLANAKSSGKHAVIGVVCGENDAGIAFHQKLGFSQVGRLPQVGRKFDRWLDAVLFQRIL